jgi:hypothetical protein
VLPAADRNSAARVKLEQRAFMNEPERSDYLAAMRARALRVTTFLFAALFIFLFLALWIRYEV